MIERSPKWHLLFWLLLILAGVASLSPYYQSLFKATMHRVIFLPVWWIATYTNLLVLMPRLWDKGRYWIHGATLGALVLLLTIAQRYICIQYIYPKYFWMRAPNADELNPFWIGPFIQFAAFIILPVILTIGLRQGFRWYKESFQAKQIIAQQNAAELNYLKAQINPHFLFNTLNSLYGLSRESSPKVPEMILKLSDTLSYSLYESSADSVSLHKEIQMIDSLISLEGERYGDRVEVDVNIDPAISMSHQIAPLLLMPLVENAFKHGVKEATSTVKINIDLSYTEQGELLFHIANDFNTNPSIANDTSSSGLGLENLRRRLNLIYPEQHSLVVAQEENTFTVKLIIPAHE